MALSNAASSVIAKQAAPRLLLRPSSFSLAPAFRPGFEWGVILQAVLTAFRLFGFSPCARPRAQANFRKPAEAGWEKPACFADPGVNAWAREKPCPDDAPRQVVKQALGVLLVLTLCFGVSSLQAAERITAVIDPTGRIIFVNEPTPVPAPTESPAPGGLPDGSAAESKSRIDSLIEQAAGEHQVDPELVRAIVQVESNYNPYAVSPRGARGLMQLIPATARRFGVTDIFDPEENLGGGIRYLKYLMGMFDGDLQLSLAAYNAGENVVARWRRVPPIPETRNYVRKIGAIYPLRRPSPPTAGNGAAPSAPRIVKAVDGNGVVHFTNTDQP